MLEKVLVFMFVLVLFLQFVDFAVYFDNRKEEGRVYWWFNCVFYDMIGVERGISFVLFCLACLHLAFFSPLLACLHLFSYLFFSPCLSWPLLAFLLLSLPVISTLLFFLAILFFLALLFLSALSYQLFYLPVLYLLCIIHKKKLYVHSSVFDKIKWMF